MYLGQIGLLAIVVGLLLLASQIIGTGCYINKKNKEKYRIISKKLITTRTSDEKIFIRDNWFKYYITKIRNVSFMIDYFFNSKKFNRSRFLMSCA